MDYFELLLFNIYKAGEENGRKHLSPRGDLDIEGSKKDFTELCGKEVRMAKAALGIASILPMPSKEQEEKIQQEAQESGLIDFLFTLI